MDSDKKSDVVSEHIVRINKDSAIFANKMVKDIEDMTRSGGILKGLQMIGRIVDGSNNAINELTAPLAKLTVEERLAVVERLVVGVNLGIALENARKAGGRLLQKFLEAI